MRARARTRTKQTNRMLILVRIISRWLFGNAGANQYLIRPSYSITQTAYSKRLDNTNELIFKCVTYTYITI
jgi:hypothetical protein